MTDTAPAGTAETVLQTPRPKLVVTVAVDVLPRPGQSAEDALAAVRSALVNNLTAGAFWEDFGAHEEDVLEAETSGETLSWGGYEGPFAVRVDVTDPS